jgi:protein-disulfide isomerase
MNTALRGAIGCLFAVALTGRISLAQVRSAQTTPEPPKIDKAAIATYLKYAEGFSPSVEVTIDDPKPSMFPGLYRLLVHLRVNRNEAARSYYITQDGERLISGSIFDLHKSPFAANVVRLKPEGAPSTGPENAPIQIYIFSDFQCPYCRQEAKVLRTGIDKSHASDVRIIFKDFPLDAIHPWARPAAIAGQCITAQNEKTFWDFHDWIYEHQSEVSVANLKDKVAEFAKSHNLDAARLSACMAEPATADRVQSTVVEGRELGVEQTPTLFVNGRMLSGALKPEQINLLIQMELDRRPKQSATVEQKCCEVSIPAVGKN